MDEAIALSTLVRSGAGAGPVRGLLELHGSAAAVLAAGPCAWRRAGLKPEHVALLSLPDARARDADAHWLSRPGHRLLGWLEDDYPALLRNSASPPAALYLAGDASLLWRAQLAVVGSRRPSAAGREHAHAFANACASAGAVVTSGLACGVDAAAHLGALEHGTTIAVLGNGIERCYPRSHRALLERIANEGVVVSEHPPETPSRKQHFPSRNRLIAGLSLATLVVEAALPSGALITARRAADAGREVFALPGSIHNPMARGCHQLIREGAALVETPEEVLSLLAPLAQSSREFLRGALPADAAAMAKSALLNGGETETGDRREILRAMSHDPVNIDQLCQRTGLTVGPLSAMLVSLELEGKITAEHGRYTRRC
jgi:DNA processing protein